MLSFSSGSGRKFCDGISRRGFMQVGSLGLAGLTLGDLLAAEAAGASAGGDRKSVIMINLAGGPSHIDTYDMKPTAPLEIRGEFTPISTAVPGLEFCELLPKQARVADKMTIVRGVRAVGQHGSHEFLTGYSYYPKNQSTANLRRPTPGAVASGRRGAPPYVSMRPKGKDDDPAQLGPAHGPLFVFDSFMRTDPAPGLARNEAISLKRLESRSSLRRQIDNARFLADVNESAASIDAFQRQALDMLSTNKVARALDVSDESEETLRLYGEHTRKGHFYGGSLLRTRRLIEAGVRVATLHFPNWDTHSKNFTHLRRELPRFDTAISGLITDLQQRGILDDTLLVMGSEMGRTPKVNDKAGRDHWPPTAVYILAGGRMNLPNVIGGTDRWGSAPTGEPITPRNVIATIYRHLGIDPTGTLYDRLGRPFELLDDRRTLRELA